jgi:hypothetical protein
MNFIKQQLIKTFIKFLNHDMVQKELDQNFLTRNTKPAKLKNIIPTYSEYKKPLTKPTTHSQSVFITSRFRSGSTLLWNVFRKLDGCTAYYEPFNERQWFNTVLRGNHTDNTHLGVTDYWTEYNDMEDLSKLYNEDWIRSSLLMDESTWNPLMKAYIDKLISNAANKSVLQFNRIDFRLPWLKKHYPNTKIIHLYRHPRDQWLSFLTDKKLMNKTDVHKTYIDGFYLDTWCRDLVKFFPFLDPDVSLHPYQRFYYLWKLSLIYGQEFSSISIQFEDLVRKPRETLNTLFQTLQWDNINWDEVLSVFEPTKIGKWKNYAEDPWFRDMEDECEAVLTSFLS